ncbi:hypothetical protein IEQ34_007020 [Dendrobium chrysotoxum]|uniref:poly(A)-specific ribonuclease n=1 Tax=Dendrobium chrysotoxum TaxID=161865 RepID=A0AAV7GRZ7_DENCH|nr:hypothetical protein IEQ34_007020 [Dendrobium chrysotoxum]
MWSLDNLNGDFAADSVEIREVWDSNLEEELSLIRSIVADYPFVSMDTEFPGVALVPVFNFREFDPARDIFDPNSIDLLRRSGIDLEKNHRLGVTADRFSELIISSGVVQNDSVQWITFHSCYDLGYLLKTLTCRNLPDSREDFYRSLRLYFPKVYDIEHLMKFCNNLYGGLNKVAEDLGVKRVGTCHQAGSDSLLAAAVFRKLKDRFFHGSVERYAGVLYGLGVA